MSNDDKDMSDGEIISMKIESHAQAFRELRDWCKKWNATIGYRPYRGDDPDGGRGGEWIGDDGVDPRGDGVDIDFYNDIQDEAITYVIEGWESFDDGSKWVRGTIWPSQIGSEDDRNDNILRRGEKVRSVLNIDTGKFGKWGEVFGHEQEKESKK